MRLSVFAAILLSLPAIAFGEPSNQEENFQQALIEATQSSNPDSFLALTCTDGVTSDWNAMLKGSNEGLLAQLRSMKSPTFVFSEFKGPQPDPIPYKETYLVPNIPITTILTITDSQSESKTHALKLKLGLKNGVLRNTTLIPKG
jgi:hypothetical protein